MKGTIDGNIESAPGFSRRVFIGSAVGISVAGIAGGGLYFASGGRSRARASLEHDLRVQVERPFVSNQGKELRLYPADVQKHVQNWFDGKCLKVRGLLEKILTFEFVSRFNDIEDNKIKAELLLAAFYGSCFTENEVLNVFQRELSNVGTLIDTNWRMFCADAAENWSVIVDKYGSQSGKTELAQQIEKSTSDAIFKSINSAAAQLNGQTTVLQSTKAIGSSALGLMEKTDVTVSKRDQVFVGNPYALAFGVPTFLLKAFEEFVRLIATWKSDPLADLQKSISSKLARLGNNVADLACDEVKERMEHLHKWQDVALNDACRDEAARLIP